MTVPAPMPDPHTKVRHLVERVLRSVRMEGPTSRVSVDARALLDLANWPRPYIGGRRAEERRHLPHDPVSSFPEHCPGCAEESGECPAAAAEEEHRWLYRHGAR